MGPPIVTDVDVEEAEEHRDAGRGQGQVDHPECTERQCITVRRGSSPYLLFPQSRLDASPDFEEVLEVDLKPRRQGIQSSVALVPQGHYVVVFAQTDKRLENHIGSKPA